MYDDEPEPHRRWLATRVSKARVAKRLEIPALAELTGISETAIRNIERGTASAKWDTICILSDALDLKLWGFEDTAPEPKNEDQNLGYWLGRITNGFTIEFTPKG